MAPDVDAPGPVRFPGQRAAHGVGQQRGEVIDAGPALDVRIGQERAVRLRDDQAEVMRFVLRDRFGQRPEVSFPGAALLAQPLEAALDEGSTLTQLQFFFFSWPCLLPSVVRPHAGLVLPFHSKPADGGTGAGILSSCRNSFTTPDSGSIIPLVAGLERGIE
jgi:hypothetical protein